MKREYPPVYPCPRQEAKECGELDLWRESHKANISCARNISGLIDTHTQDGQLKPDTAQFALRNWGFRRVQFVLANTLIGTGALDFEPESVRWARTAYVPPDKENPKFRIQADRPLLSQFLRQTYDVFLAQWMFGPEHCGPSDQDYTGKVLALRPDRLDESSLSAQNQFWLAESGFGLSPTSSGRAVFATCLGDGEKARWNRSDFMGPLDEQYLPDWAAEKLAELRNPGQEQTDGPSLGGMEMR